MERYVDVEVLKENFAKRLNQHDGISINVDDAAVTIALAIADTPTADVVEVKHGEWIRPTIIHGMTIAGLPHCSVCGEVPCDEGKYCPNCGAIMDGESRIN